MLFSSENWNDIQRYYEGTYLKFKEKGDQLFFIEGVNPHKVYGVLEDQTKFELYLDNEHPYEVDYVLPHKSYFQHKEHACILQRIPAKQYQRGISNKNTKIWFLEKDGRFIASELSFDLLASYINKPQIQTIDGALCDGKNSSVLSPRFAFCREGGLYLDSILVATMNMQSRKINVKKKIFSSEIKELIKNTVLVTL